MLLLLSAMIEHLLEELELGVCACYEQEDCPEEGGEKSCHYGVGAKRRGLRLKVRLKLYGHAKEKSHAVPNF